MRKKREHDLVRSSLPGDLTEVLVSRILALPSSLKTDYLKQEFMSKYVSPITDPPSVRRNRAMSKWLAAERDNEATNVRLLLTPDGYQILPRVSYKRFINFCHGLVSKIIGDTPPIEALLGSFSGGASTSRPRTDSHPASKYVGKAHVTQRAAEHLPLLKEMLPLWLSDYDVLRPEDIVGNVFFTVPKKTDIDRVACKEPDVNMYVQKGIGKYFRSCLLKHHINLNDQSINRSLAREGSITKKLCTMDLSSASDSVTRELVFQLLPVSWFTLLDSVRSPTTVIDGVEHQNEMFSSMGNGFTFELESLLFYVITRAVARFRGVSGVVSIYGDDIICNTDMFHELSFVLNYLGFQVNTEKSWFEGDFRESCGGHYHDGYDITPFYIRAPIETLPDLIDVANKLRQWSAHRGKSSPEDDPFLDWVAEDIWLWLKSLVPDSLWGGVDTTFKYQLVSHDTPKYRLSEETKRKDTGLGGYLHWHDSKDRELADNEHLLLRRQYWPDPKFNAKWDRDYLAEGIKTSSRSINLGKLRVKKARISTVSRLLTYFSSEL